MSFPGPTTHQPQIHLPISYREYDEPRERKVIGYGSFLNIAFGDTNSKSIKVSIQIVQHNLFSFRFVSLGRDLVVPILNSWLQSLNRPSVGWVWPIRDTLVRMMVDFFWTSEWPPLVHGEPQTRKSIDSESILCCSRYTEDPKNHELLIQTDQPDLDASRVLSTSVIEKISCIGRIKGNPSISYRSFFLSLKAAHQGCKLMLIVLDPTWGSQIFAAASRNWHGERRCGGSPGVCDP